MAVVQNEEQNVITFKTKCLTTEQKNQVFRFCGYSTDPKEEITNSSWIWLQNYGRLNYRLSALSIPETNEVLQYLNTLEILELQLLKDENDQVITDTTTFTPNIVEVRKRIGFFNEYRQRLCAFFQIPPGPIYPKLS